MFGRSSLITFSIREPYHSALPLVLRTLTQHGLRVPVELDVASSIKQELGAGVAPCTILLVDDPELLLEGIVLNRGAALRIPQRLVISGNDLRTEIFIGGLKSHAGRDFLASLDRPLVALQARILQALEAIAQRDVDPSLVNY